MKLLSCKRTCKRCGKNYFTFNLSQSGDVPKIMKEKKICWECAYWEWFAKSPPEHLEIIGNKCYQIFPFVETDSIFQILGGRGKIKYLLKRDGTCQKVNDIWWLNTIPWQYQQQPELQPTGWWVTKRFYGKFIKMKKLCTAKGCLDRYHCYRYQYQQEFGTPPYNYVPRDWIVGSERCPAFLPLKDIDGYDEYVKPSDIIDESSVICKNLKQ